MEITHMEGQRLFTYAPVVGVIDGHYVALQLGPATVAFGERVVVETPDGVAVDEAYVAATDTAAANEFVPEVTALFGAKDAAAFHTLLEKAYGTGLPHTVEVTIYTLYPTPVEETASAEG
jgi:hypothetical protein